MTFLAGVFIGSILGYLTGSLVRGSRMKAEEAAITRAEATFRGFVDEVKKTPE